MEVSKEKMFTLKIQREAGRLKVTYWKNKVFEKIFRDAEKTTGKYGGLSFQYSRRSQVVDEIIRMNRNAGYVDTLEGDCYALGYDGAFNMGLLRIDTGENGLTFDATSGGVEILEFIEKAKLAHQAIYEKLAQGLIIDVEVNVRIAKE